MLREAVEQPKGEFVLLCDEPEQWMASEASEESEDAFVQNRKEQVFQAIWNWKCRRVFAGSPARHGLSPRLRDYKLPFDAIRFLEQQWGNLTDVAHELYDRLGAQVVGQHQPVASLDGRAGQSLVRDCRRPTLSRLSGRLASRVQGPGVPFRRSAVNSFVGPLGKAGIVSRRHAVSARQ